MPVFRARTHAKGDKREIFSFVINDSQPDRVLVFMPHKSRHTLYEVHQIRCSIPHTRTVDSCHIMVKYNDLLSDKFGLAE